MDFVRPGFFDRGSNGLKRKTTNSQQEIVKMGKVKYVGVSEFSPAWTRAMHAIHPVTAMQIEWSLVTRKLGVSGSLVGLGIVENTNKQTKRVLVSLVVDLKRHFQKIMQEIWAQKSVKAPLF